MGYGFLADLIVAVHAAYVGYIVLGLLAILIGAVCRWSWVRNPWFRLTHLLAIAIVALEAAWGIDCPLTVWEYALRQQAGQAVSGDSFVGRCLHSLIFYDCPPGVLDAVHIGFALLVLGTFFLVPPRWPRAAAR